jgi:hypothetical protein
MPESQIWPCLLIDFQNVLGIPDFVVAYFSGISVGSLRAHSAAHPHLVSTFF